MKTYCLSRSRRIVKSISLFLIAFIGIFLFPAYSFSKPVKMADTLDIGFINDMVLKGEVAKVLTMLDTISLVRPSDKAYKLRFENRFKYQADRTNFLEDVPLTLQPLFLVYQHYWRECLLDNAKINDLRFKDLLIDFFIKQNRAEHFTDLMIDETTLERVQKIYITKKHYFANDFGRTGFLYDLLLWKDVDPTMYNVALIDDTVKVKVNFINKFISLGWLGYARLGRGPGGWATNDELFCVANAYKDKSDEEFSVSYLKHEGQHFHDYKAFPNLPGKDLEYRGKILEFYYSDKQMFKLIFDFIDGGKNDITNAHPFANYCIIRDMSRILFNSGPEYDLNKWRKVGIPRIHEAAKELYLSNTQNLKNGLLLK